MWRSEHSGTCSHLRFCHVLPWFCRHSVSLHENYISQNSLRHQLFATRVSDVMMAIKHPADRFSLRRSFGFIAGIEMTDEG